MLTTNRFGHPGGLWLACLLALAGCTKTEPPNFRLNMQDIVQNMASHEPDQFRLTGSEADDEEVRDKQKNIDNLQLISTVLYAAFGTPDKPYLFEEVRWNPEEQTGLDLEKIRLAAGPVGGGRHGEARGLYRRHCAHCHGISGDGAGPTAGFLNPYPRDYRQGKFKFKSTEFAARPTTADLERTLREGIPGTAMPSFALLPSDEIDALVEYVKYLSIRGETEQSLAITLLTDDEELEPTRTAILEEHLQGVVDRWTEAPEQVVHPDPQKRPAVDTPQKLQASIAAGRKVFQSKEAQCVQCHGPTGLGDGWGPDKLDPYDDWNKDKKPDEIARWLLPPQELKPRNLRLGVYRGGRRPIDLFRRISVGIPGAQMPGSGPGPGKPEGTLTDEQIWHLVNYVRSLPYEPIPQPPRSEAVVYRAPN